MSLQAMHVEIMGRFQTLWGVTTPVNLPNERFDPPTSEPYVIIRILPTSKTNAVGNSYNEIGGSIVIQIKTPAGRIGQKSANDLYDLILPIFNTKTFGSTSTSPTVPRFVGDNNEGWFQINAITQFRYRV